MNKDFSLWHLIKESLHKRPPQIFFHEREVWYAALGVNIGFEEDGKGDQFSRPIIILKKFNRSVFWSLPLSRTPRTGKYYFQFSFKENTTSTALLSQIKLMDERRLISKIGTVEKKTFREIQHKIRDLLVSD